MSKKPVDAAASTIPAPEPPEQSTDNPQLVENGDQGEGEQVELTPQLAVREVSDLIAGFDHDTRVRVLRATAMLFGIDLAEVLPDDHE